MEKLNKNDILLVSGGDIVDTIAANGHEAHSAHETYVLLTHEEVNPYQDEGLSWPTTPKMPLDYDYYDLNIYYD